MGDYVTENGTYAFVTIDQAREMAKNSVNGIITESKQGFTTTFIEYSTGKIIGTFYER